MADRDAQTPVSGAGPVSENMSGETGNAMGGDLAGASGGDPSRAMGRKGAEGTDAVIPGGDRGGTGAVGEDMAGLTNAGTGAPDQGGPAPASGNAFDVAAGGAQGSQGHDPGAASGFDASDAYTGGSGVEDDEGAGEGS